MFEWRLSDAALASAASARGKTLMLRAAHNAAFATGVGLVTASVVLPLVLYVVIFAMMVLDAWAGNAFVAATGRKRAWLRALFVTSSVATISGFIALALVAALYGGAEGRLAAAFLAVGSLATVMVLMVEAPLFMAMCAAPSVALLGALPLIPMSVAHDQRLLAAVGVYLTLGAFISHVGRIAVQHILVVRRLDGSREEAERRREEAELRRVEADTHRRAAEKANRVKTEFLTTMTHELRTPLNAVINYSEMIAEDAQGAVAEDAGRIKKSAHHLLGLIDRILEFSMLDSGDVRLAADKFSARDVLLDVAGQYRAAAAAQGNVLRVEGEADLLLSGDRRRFAQCMDCFVSNAVKFTQNGAVTLYVREEAGVAVAGVADTGAGMSAQALEKVFEAFAQSDGSLTRASDGLGLGLAMARRIAQAMGGDVTAESVVGQGSRFEIRLPLENAQAIAA